MKTGEMFNFSSNLWYNSRAISKDGIASVYLQVVIDGKHKEFNLKLRWPVSNIDVSAGCLTPRFKKDPEVDDYNLIINSERAKHTEIQRTYRLRKEPLDIHKFAREVNIFDQNECFASYIERERNRRFKRKEIELKTYQNAGATRMKILEYDNLALFKDIDAKWIAGFKAFLENKKYAPGTIWDRIKITKRYLNLASVEPLIYVNPTALSFPNPKPRFKTTYCTREEIRRLMILLDGDISDKEERVLRAFLFTCFTSLRISDLYRVNARWEVQDHFLEFVPKKNMKKGRTLKIPLMDVAKSFIRNSGGLYFDLPNSVEYNVTLKDLADKANINKNLTSHVGRHTFGYLYMTTKGDIYGLQQILGHSKLETTERYAHIDDDYKLSSVKMIQEDFRDLVLRKVN